MSSELRFNSRPRLRDIGNIALPMVVSQASETIMMFVDRLFVSRLTPLHIAGAMSGGVTSYTVMSLFLGILGYVNAVVAQNDGAGNKPMCARATAQSFRLAFLAWPIILLTIPLIKMYFQAMGHTPELIGLEHGYFRIVIFGSIFALIKMALSGFFIGLGRTRVVMIANVIGMFINIPANWILVFGKLGFPAMGMAGAAIGTILGSACIMFILLGVYLSPRYRNEYGTHRETRFDGRLMKLLLEYGSPAGLETFLNVAVFNFFLQLMNSYGSDTATAVTIAFNYDMMVFVPMLGLGLAATTLSGRYVGAQNIPGVERSMRLTLFSAWSYAALMTILLVAAAKPLVSLFLPETDPGSAASRPLAETMLRMAAIYVLADATQVVFSGILRGAGDTKYVMIISVGLHWLFAPVAWYAVKVAGIAPIPMWGIFIGFVFSLGIAMFLRYRFGGWRKRNLVKGT